MTWAGWGDVRRSFSTEIRVSQRRRIRRYFSPERAIPKRKRQCVSPQTIGPSTTTSIGRRRYKQRVPSALMTGQHKAKLRQIASTPRRMRAVGLPRNSRRSARALTARRTYEYFSNRRPSLYANSFTIEFLSSIRKRLMNVTMPPKRRPYRILSEAARVEERL
jgi:hypothetical protein